MTLDEVIAKVRDNREPSAPLPKYEARLLVSEIERLRRAANLLRTGLQIIADNPDWHDHPTRAAEALARASSELQKPVV